MANWWESVKLQLTPSDREWALRCAKILEKRRQEGDTTDKRASQYWTSFEIDEYGRLAEAAVSRHFGLPLPDPDDFCYQQNDGGIDLPGLDIGVKCSPWRRIEHFHLCRGGRLIVPLRPYGFSGAYLLCTYFVGSRRCFLDGYATAGMLRNARRLRSNEGKPAVEIPYAELLPAARFLASAC